MATPDATSSAASAASTARPATESELDDGRMSFVEHLRELRDRVRAAAIAFVLAFGVCWFYSKEIYNWLLQPLANAWAPHAARTGRELPLAFGSITEPFWVYMSIALWAGFFVASPIIFHQLWKFIAPGLYKRERRTGLVFAVASAVCFVSGALFCYYFVLERMIVYLLGVADESFQATIFMRTYFDDAKAFLLAFGVVFELPVFVFFLSLAGLVTAKKLWKFNRWFVVIAFVVGGVLTPSPDAVSQLLLALPMIVLYNVAIVVALFVERGRRKRDAEAAKSTA